MMQANSKGIIVMSVLIWLIMRILYFSVSLYTIEPSKSTICVLEVMQNLPIFCIYICILICHRFLLNMYAVIQKREQTRRLRRINVYFWVGAIFNFISIAFDTTVICANYNVITQEDGGLAQVLVIKSAFIVWISLFLNSVISIVVIPEIRKQAGFKLISWYIIIMCSAFEMILIFRAWIVVYQRDMKEEQPELWRKIMISYFTCCELLFYTFVIGQIVLQTYKRAQIGKLRKRLRENSIDCAASQEVRKMIENREENTTEAGQYNNLLTRSDFLLQSIDQGSSKQQWMLSPTDDVDDSDDQKKPEDAKNQKSSDLHRESVVTIERPRVGTDTAIDLY